MLWKVKVPENDQMKFIVEVGPAYETTPYTLIVDWHQHPVTWRVLNALAKGEVMAEYPQEPPQHPASQPSDSYTPETAPSRFPRESPAASPGPEARPQS